MKRYRLHTLHHVGPEREFGEKIDVVYEEIQPAKDLVLGWLTWRLDQLTYKPWPRSWTAKAWSTVDRAGDALHRRQTGCQDDCGTWYRRLPTDEPTGGFEMDEEHAIPGCTYHGPSIEWDLWIYHVMERNKTYGRTFVEETAVPYWITKEERREGRTGG